MTIGVSILVVCCCLKKQQHASIFILTYVLPIADMLNQPTSSSPKCDFKTWNPLNTVYFSTPHHTAIKTKPHQSSVICHSVVNLFPFISEIK